MNEIIRWVIGGAFAFVLLMFGIEKRKTAKVTKAKEKAEDERDQYKVVNKVYQDADQIKDELVQKKAELDREEKEVVQSIASIPEEKEEELSEEEKQIASDQYARARDRAERLQNRSTGR